MSPRLTRGLFQGILAIRRTSLQGQAGCRFSSSFSFSKEEDHLVVKDAAAKREAKFHFQWLRDHCRSPKVYNHSTHQRSISLLEFPDDITPTKINLDADKLNVNWSDNHNSSFDLAWLLSDECAVPATRAEAFRLKTPRTTWNKASFPEKNATTPYEQFLNDPKPVAESLLRHGFALVSGVDVSTAATQECVERFVPVTHTLYGQMFELFSEAPLEGVSDSSYSKVGLGPHTDTTYYNEALGLQIFHCLLPSPVGGETILVDGFKIAEIARKEHPEMFKLFSEFPLEAEYIHDSPRDHYHVVDSVFKHHPVSGELEQFRFNVYDRAVHKMTLEQQRVFYKHYRTLAKLVNDPENAAWVKLQPGSVLFINNWRVMHGRAAFEGNRKMCGCYVGRTEFMSRAKVLGVV